MSEHLDHILFGFLNRAADDPRICIGHLGLFTALYHKWVDQGSSEPLAIYAYEAMPLAKISCRVTYLKLLHGLNEYGYLKYSPSFRGKKSRISFLN